MRSSYRTRLWWSCAATCCAVLGAFSSIEHAGGQPLAAMPGRASGAFGLHVAVEPGCVIRAIGTISVTTKDRTPVIGASVNGHPLTLVLDTGGERSIITPAAAVRIGAQPPRVEFSRQLRGLAGKLATREVELSSFLAGGVAIPLRRILVAPLPTRMGPESPIDGLLGADALRFFDIDLDLPHNRLVLYAKQACSNAVPDWTGPYTPIDGVGFPGAHLVFPVRLDGHRVLAFIDTGAQRTMLSATTARALGVTEGALARDRLVILRGIAAEQLISRVHRFSRLEIGDAAIPYPELAVAEVIFRNAGLVLGMDLLSSRRLWISYGARRIFLGGG
jgi:predicted aspartyl protease